MFTRDTRFELDHRLCRKRLCRKILIKDSYSNMRQIFAFQCAFNFIIVIAKENKFMQIEINGINILTSSSYKSKFLLQYKDYLYKYRISVESSCVLLNVEGLLFHYSNQREKVDFFSKLHVVYFLNFFNCCFSSKLTKIKKKTKS